VDWVDVDHVILTHPDHAGSIPAVLAAAAGATAYAGEPNIPAIQSPPCSPGRRRRRRGLRPPDHRHSWPDRLLDPGGRFLVAGDALTTSGTGVAGPNEGFTAELAQAHDSVRKLAQLTFADVLAGHAIP
jgi:glyoxylase-like metal-dependent hydrolase (beta-lactamase superfamily II)